VEHVEPREAQVVEDVGQVHRRPEQEDQVQGADRDQRPRRAHRVGRPHHHEVQAIEEDGEADEGLDRDRLGEAVERPA